MIFIISTASIRIHIYTFHISSQVNFVGEGYDNNTLELEHNPNDDPNRIMIHGILSRVPVALALSDSWTIKSKSCRSTPYFSPNNFVEFAIDDYIMKKKARGLDPSHETGYQYYSPSPFFIFSHFMGIIPSMSQDLKSKHCISA